MTEKPAPPPAPSEPIPALTSIAPAIFVPIPPFFFSQPVVDQASSSSSPLESQAACVKANIVALTRRECVRIQLQQQNHPRDDPPRRVPTEHDIHFLVNNLEAAGASAGANSPEARRSAAAAPVPSVPDFSAHPPAYKGVMETIWQTMKELQGYEEHVGRTREKYERAMMGDDDKEMQIDG